jgi:hypothetical protein
MNVMRKATLSLAMASSLIALTASGCGDAGPVYYEVTGKVTLKDGTPIKSGFVIFHPDARKGNKGRETGTGTIRDGVYTLKTGMNDGCPPGAYKVSVEAASEVDERNPYYTKWLAHEKYVHPDRSQLTAVVVETPETGRYDFKLDPHPKAKRR